MAEVEAFLQDNEGGGAQVNEGGEAQVNEGGEEDV